MTKSEKVHPLEKIIRSLYPDFPEDGSELIDQYEKAIKQNGLGSEKVSEIYNAIVGKDNSMKKWLDAINYFASRSSYPF